MCIRDSFRVDVHATTAGGRKVVSTVAADGDPGYAATAVMSVSYTHLTLPTSDLV